VITFYIRQSGGIRPLFNKKVTAESAKKKKRKDRRELIGWLSNLQFPLRSLRFLCGFCVKLPQATIGDSREKAPVFFRRMTAGKAVFSIEAANVGQPLKGQT
jgi:hypothetical protein